VILPAGGGPSDWDASTCIGAFPCSTQDSSTDIMAKLDVELNRGTQWSVIEAQRLGRCATIRSDGKSSHFGKRELTMKQLFGGALGACACVVALSGALLARPASQGPQAANQGQAQEKDDPSKGSKDVDETVAYPMARVLDAIKQALATYGCDIKKDKPDYLECTRDRHVGVMVGSGGEKVTVQLTAKGSDTRVEIKTGKGFVGRLGKKNWSTPIFDEAMKTLKGS
jgi:hypothetical protein